MKPLTRLISGAVFTNTLPVNVIEKDKHLFAKHIQTNVAESNLYQLHNCLFLPEIILFKRGLFKSVLTNRYLNNKRYLFRVFRNYIKRRTKKIKGTYLLGIDDWSNGYYHWMTDVLQRLFISMPYVNKNIKLLLPDFFQQNQYMIDTLKLFGYEIFYYSAKHNYKIEHLLIPGHAGPSGIFHYDTINRLSAWIKTKVLPSKDTGTPYEKIYISRKNATRRRLLNEEKISFLLENYGFKVIDMEDLCFAEQVSLLHNAKYVISLHGAGLTNVLFMQKGGYVMEIRHPMDDSNNCYYLLAAALNQHYFYFLANTQSKDPHAANMEINTESFLPVVENFIGAKNEIEPVNEFS